MTLDWNCGPLAQGLACYRSAQFFEAHEHWESVWLTIAEPEKSFLQALIQVTAACHHFKAGNQSGAASLLRRAMRRLEQCPASFGGIEVAPLCAEVSEWLRVIESESPVRTPTHPHISPTDARLE